MKKGRMNRKSSWLILCCLIILPISKQLYAEPKMVIQVFNKHYVSPEVFTVEMNAQDSSLTQEQIDTQYADFLEELEEIQKRQRELILVFIDEFKMKAIYIEGLTEKNHKSAMKFIETLKEYEKKKDVNNLVLETQNKIDLLEIGAAGQLVVQGDLETILPTDDSKAMEAANPLRPDGKIVFDKKAIEAREDAIIKNLRQSNQKIVIVVLDKDHDLSDNIKRLMKNCRYRRVDIPKSVKNIRFWRKRKKK